jgi:hypothetical protein
VERTPLGMAEYMKHYRNIQSDESLGPLSQSLYSEEHEAPFSLVDYSQVTPSFNYLPECHIASSVPELPILAASPPNALEFIQNGRQVGRVKPNGSQREAILPIQQALTIILAQRGFQSTHKIPFEVLADLLISFISRITRKIRLNNIQDPLVSPLSSVEPLSQDSFRKEMMQLLLKEMQPSVKEKKSPSSTMQELRQYMDEVNLEKRKELEEAILKDPIYEVAPPSPIDEGELEVTVQAPSQPNIPVPPSNGLE